MCWTMTVPGASPGRDASTSRMASVPPVEAPMANTMWVVRSREGSTESAG